MKTFCINNRTYAESDVKAMSLDELQVLTAEIQAEIHKFSKQRQSLTDSQKNSKSRRQLKFINSKIMDLQDIQNNVSIYRRWKRDNMAREKEYFKTFYDIVKSSVKSSVFEKIKTETAIQVGYSINY